MLDLSSLLIAHPFPTALARIRQSFARQPDCQTCGASAIRHGLLLGGLTLPTATLEAVLGIRRHEGTPPGTLPARPRGAPPPAPWAGRRTWSATPPACPPRASSTASPPTWPPAASSSPA